MVESMEYKEFGVNYDPISLFSSGRAFKLFFMFNMGADL